jgi:hypothetical protein
VDGPLTASVCQNGGRQRSPATGAIANLPNYVLDRLSRYEVTLWRQVGQILFALDSLDRRKPQERKRKSFISNEGPPHHGGYDY